MASMTTPDLLDVFKNMTVLELNDFLKAFEEEFGVTAAAPVAVAAAPAAGGGGGDAGAAEEKDEFDVILTAAGAQKNLGTAELIALRGGAVSGFLVMALGLLASPLLAQKPDFSGTWKLNAEKSDPIPTPPAGGGGGQRPGGMGGGMRPSELFITHSDSKMVIEQKIGDRTMLLTYYLDGRDSKNPGMRGTELTTKSVWVENTIITDGENTFTTPMGEMTIKTHEIRSLSEDGKIMIIVSTVTSPRGEMTRKTAYDKA